MKTNPINPTAEAPFIDRRLSIDDYHRGAAHREYLSASTLKHGLRSMAELAWYRDHDEPPSSQSHFEFGNAFEMALLDPADYSQRIVDESVILGKIQASGKDYSKPRATAAYREWRAQCEEQGKIILPVEGSESVQAIERMLGSCLQNPALCKLMQVGSTAQPTADPSNGPILQPSLFWVDEASGLSLKSRPDWAHPARGVIIDVKTTADGSPKTFGYTARKLGYALQATLQIEGAIATGLMEAVEAYFWLAVEKEPPYCATLYEFTLIDRAIHKARCADLLRQVAESISTGNYPGYEQPDTPDALRGIVSLTLPIE